MNILGTVASTERCISEVCMHGHSIFIVTHNYIYCMYTHTLYYSGATLARLGAAATLRIDSKSSVTRLYVNMTAVKPLSGSGESRSRSVPAVVNYKNSKTQ